MANFWERVPKGNAKVAAILGVFYILIIFHYFRVSIYDCIPELLTMIKLLPFSFVFSRRIR